MSLKNIHINSLLKLWAVVDSTSKLGMRYCFDCEQVVGIADNDSCYSCGHRYSPVTDGEDCPKCGSSDYECHCERCDSKHIDDLEFVVRNIYDEVITLAGIKNIKKWCKNIIESKIQEL
jgi:hypothetical protein